jgi:predicted metal-dependent hydrolase
VRLGFDFRSVAIRDPRTRWGSCSRPRRVNLSFSWRLLLAPADVLHYVVVHELCHLREPSHQKAFWSLLESVRPGWQREVRWLRDHGQELHEFLVGITAAFGLRRSI